MTNLDSILKSIDITLPTKVCIVKAMVFPVVMYGCESWTIKKAEGQRIDTFELWCWRRLLRAPWTARKSNQTILMEISPEYSLEGLMLKLKLQYFGHMMWRTDSLEKDPDAGKNWRQEEKGMTEDEMVGWHHWLDGHEFEQALGVGDGQGGLVCCSPWGRKELDTTEQLNWTEKVNLRSWWRRLLMLLRINPWLRFTNASWDFHEKKYLTNWSRALSKLRFPRLFWSKTRCLRESRLLTQDQQKKK